MKESLFAKISTSMMKARLIFALVALAVFSATAGSYTVSNTAADLGTISFPSTIAGTLSSAYGSLIDGYYDVITFKPNASGSRKISITFSLDWGAKHSFRTTVYKGTVSKLATLSNAASTTLSLSAGQYYTIRVEMLSPSTYTTTRYSYKLTLGGSSSGGGDDGYYPSLSCSATNGKYQDYVKISWAAVSGATAYRVLRGTSTNADAAKEIYEGTGRSYKDKKAKVGYKYYYWAAYKKGGKWWRTRAGYNAGYRKIKLKAYYPSSVKVGKTAKLKLKVNGKFVTSGMSFSPKSCTNFKISTYKTSPYFAKVKGRKAGKKNVKITYGKTVKASVSVPIKVVKK